MPTGTEHHTQRRIPAFKVGDIVFADRSWMLVTDKVGQRCKGRLVGREALEYQFTSRRVERVFRELGRRQKGE